MRTHLGASRATLGIKAIDGGGKFMLNVVIVYVL
jgi:hypothetical protein